MKENNVIDPKQIDTAEAVQTFLVKKNLLLKGNKIAVALKIHNNIVSRTDDMCSADFTVNIIVNVMHSLNSGFHIRSTGPSFMS